MSQQQQKCVNVKEKKKYNMYRFNLNQFDINQCKLNADSEDVNDIKEDIDVRDIIGVLGF
jgi:hypothetical protein